MKDEVPSFGAVGESPHQNFFTKKEIKQVVRTKTICPVKVFHVRRKMMQHRALERREVGEG